MTGRCKLSGTELGIFATDRVQSWKKATDGTSAGEHKGLNWPLVKSGLFNWQTWMAILFYISIVTPLYSVALFVPTMYVMPLFDC